MYIGSRENIKEVLKVLIKHKRITQKEFASAIGVQEAAISKWLSGMQIPQVELYDIICDYFEISLDQLFGRKSLDF